MTLHPAGRLSGRRVLLIVSGGIAAYKALELVRLLRAGGADVIPVLTAGGAQFVTPLSLQALCEQPVHQDLWSLTGESRMGHIAMSRSADLVVVAPASADLLAKMTAGLADDLATTLLLATDTKVLAAPAMNVRMWQHAATTANMAVLRARGIAFVGPDEGPMACGEYGPGRMAEPAAILEAICQTLGAREPAAGPLAGKRAVVTSGPTHEPIDPVRYIANRSSGRQGHAIASALAASGAQVRLIHGPVSLADPAGVEAVAVETAAQMRAAVLQALPADIFVAAAAVGDWRVEPGAQKLKKGQTPPVLTLHANEDILAEVAARPDRPALVIGFAAETEQMLDHARAKRLRKGCDWLLANDVGEGSQVMGGACNQVILLDGAQEEHWPKMDKAAVAERLTQRIAVHLTRSED